MIGLFFFTYYLQDSRPYPTKFTLICFTMLRSAILQSLCKSLIEIKFAVDSMIEYDSFKNFTLRTQLTCWPSYYLFIIVLFVDAE